MPLSDSQLCWLLERLHHAAGQPAPPTALCAAMVAQGSLSTMRTLKNLDGFEAEHLSRLCVALTQDDFAAHITDALQQLTQQKAHTPTIPPPPHPLGEDATFPPLVAQTLGMLGARVHGEALPLRGFPFGERIVGFREALRRTPPTSALVIGGGYVGAEMAVGWAQQGTAVTLLDRRDELMRGYIRSAVANVERLMQEMGVALRLKVEARGWQPQGEHIVLQTRQDGVDTSLIADVILVAVGVTSRPPWNADA